MRNLKVTRQLRGQTASGLRRRLRKAEARNAELEKENGFLAAENARLRRRPPQKLPIPEGFSNSIVQRLGEYLARGLARKVEAEVPELARAAHASARTMGQVLAGNLRLSIDPYGEVAYEVEEMIRHQDDLKFSLILHGVHIHFGENLKHIQTMRPSLDPCTETYREPKRVHVTNRDLAAAS